MPSQGHSAKVFQKKNVIFFNSSLCRVPKLLGTRQRHFKKNIESLPSAVSGALGKVFSKKNLCRVPNNRHSAKKDVAEHRYAGQPMPSAALLPRAWHSAKKSFAECPFLPSAILCRVRHSTKKVFVECPIFDTRQSSLYLAKALFPVVLAAEKRYVSAVSSLRMVAWGMQRQNRNATCEAQSGTKRKNHRLK